MRLGGTFAMVGPGSLNASGAVAFLASGSTSGPSDVFLWNGASTSKVAAAGDAAPLGSTYQFLGSESFGFTDGSTIPAGPVPDIDNAGNVVFRAITVDGRRGIVHQPAGGGAASWIFSSPSCSPTMRVREARGWTMTDSSTPSGRGLSQEGATGYSPLVAFFCERKDTLSSMRA